MGIFETIKNDAELSEMYMTMNYAFIADTLTPAQIAYLVQNDEALEKWCYEVARRVANYVHKRVDWYTDRITGDNWGTVILNSVKRHEETNEVVPDTVSLNPYNVLGRCISYEKE